MSIESKHAYRFVYLKSEKWQSVRLEALAREQGKCQICYEYSLHNDANHVWYPENIWDTKSSQLVVLCRPCHEFIHAMILECKTSNEQDGTNNWLNFSNAIIVWRRQKMELFGDATGIPIKTPKSLREELQRVNGVLSSYQNKFGVIDWTTEKPVQKTLQQEIDSVLSSVRTWAVAYKRYVSNGHLSVAESDFEI